VTIEEKLAARLLAEPEDDVRITHDRLAEQLGVSRQRASIAASVLQRAGFIRCHRGHITILDREGLRVAAPLEQVVPGAS
jgi:CRP-like cAMP-binding protein